MGLDIQAFNTAAYADSDRGFVRLAKDGKSLETVGTTRFVGTLRAKVFLSPSARDRETRVALFQAVRDSLGNVPVNASIRKFLGEIADKLGVKLDGKGALAQGEAALGSSDKPLERRVIREVLSQLGGMRNGGELDATWMKTVRNNVSTFTWSHEGLANRLRARDWVKDDKLRDLVVGAMKQNNAELRAQAEKKSPETAEKTSETKGTGTKIEPSMTGVVKSVRENPAGGQCFFYSALQQIKDCTNPLDAGNAAELRKKLAAHGKSLAEQAEAGKISAEGLQKGTDGIWTVPTGAGRQNVNLAVDQCRKDGFGTGTEWTEFQQGAFLADMLKRPVTIVASSIPDGHKITYDCDLTNGKKLEGDPIVIYYTHADRHFRAAEL